MHEHTGRPDPDARSLASDVGWTFLDDAELNAATAILYRIVIGCEEDPASAILELARAYEAVTHGFGYRSGRSFGA